MSLKQPYFSVIIPVYNHEKYIGTAIESLLAQTDADFEAIVVNDGSVDGTPGIVDRYAVWDSRIRVFHKSNGGVSSALNMGLRFAKGRWICWLSSDDLFAPGKLATHRDWINRFPHARFFCSDYRELEDESGELRDGDDWTVAPDPPWQVFEMMRCTFIHGNSICVDAKLLAEVGDFDETMRYGQDYDMWLRVLLHVPVIHIPERTCVTRWHAAQVTHGFSEACLFDSARAAIRVLNRTKFSQLVQGVGTENKELAQQVLRASLAVAGNPGAFVYKLGPHPLLMNRIQEWVWNESPSAFRRYLKGVFCDEVERMVTRQENPVLKLHLNLSLVLGRTRTGPCSGCQCSPEWIAESWHAHLAARGDLRAFDLQRYRERYLAAPPASIYPAVPPSPTTVIIVLQQNSIVSGEVKYGAARATFEVSRQLRKAGITSVLVGLSSQWMGLSESDYYVGGASEHEIRKIVRALNDVDAVIGISRPDITGLTSVGRCILYLHDPKPLPGIDAFLLKMAKIPVVCVSGFMRTIQAHHGLRPAQLQVVRNGYDQSIFTPGEETFRDSRQLVMAATLGEHKGVDIALTAFQKVRQVFPDATLRVYGGNFEWSGVPVDCSRKGWVTPKGEMDWATIEQDCPGVRYCGEVTQPQLAAAFRVASLIVMPSRMAESFGLVSIEAQACGCMPVLPRKGGFPETMSENKTGYLYDENGADSLADMIIFLWRAGLPSDEQRAYAQEWVRHEFSWDATGIGMIDALNSCSDRRTLGRGVARILSAACHSWRYTPTVKSLAWKVQVAREIVVGLK